MLRILLSHPWLIFFLSATQVLAPCIVHPATRGIVSYSLEWGSLRQTYHYIFTGIVLCGPNPCDGALVRVQLSPDHSPMATAQTRTSRNGHFEIQISCEGSSSESAIWRILAAASSPGGGDPVQLEGRIILTEDQTSLVVERPVQIGRS